MSQIYRCMSCGRQFKSSLKSGAKCPGCKSDNLVALQSTTSPGIKPVLIILGVALIAVLGILGYKYLNAPSTAEGEQPAAAATDNTVRIQDVGFAEAPKLNKNNRYDFKVTAHVSDTKYDKRLMYTLTDEAQHRYLSRDGVFKDIPGTESGLYTMRVTVRRDKTIEPVIMSIDGLVKPDNTVAETKAPEPAKETVVTKPTIAEVQGWVNALYSGSGVQPLYNEGGKYKVDDRNLTFKFTNIRSGETVPNSLSGLQEKFEFGNWKALTVTNVGYNDKGYVNSITMKIIYPDAE